MFFSAEHIDDEDDSDDDFQVNILMVLVMTMTMITKEMMITTKSKVSGSQSGVNRALK